MYPRRHQYPYVLRSQVFLSSFAVVGKAVALVIKLSRVGFLLPWVSFNSFNRLLWLMQSSIFSHFFSLSFFTFSFAAANSLRNSSLNIFISWFRSKPSGIEGCFVGAVCAASNKFQNANNNKSFEAISDFDITCVYLNRKKFQDITLHKKWSFPLRIFSVNIAKSAENCGFGHIY